MLFMLQNVTEIYWVKKSATWTGNAFKTAKAKSDYIDNRSSDDSKSNTSTSSTKKEKYNNIPSDVKNVKDLKKVIENNKLDIVPNSIEKVPVAKRPKLYDDGKSDPKKDGSKVKMSRAEKKYLKSKLLFNFNLYFLLALFLAPSFINLISLGIDGLNQNLLLRLFNIASFLVVIHFAMGYFKANSNENFLNLVHNKKFSVDFVY